MKNVLDLIRPLLTFDSKDDFYYLQVLQRKKENPQLGSNSRVIKNYYINSIEYLENRFSEIEELCNTFNARAMLRLNKRSYEKVAFRAMVNMANVLSNKEFKFSNKVYDRACGETHNDKNKKWIIDLDGDEVNYKDSIIEYINTLQPDGEKVYTILPTKNGIHIITKPFNRKEFGNKYPTVDIHCDNPINLFWKE